MGKGEGRRSDQQKLSETVLEMSELMNSRLVDLEQQSYGDNETGDR